MACYIWLANIERRKMIITVIIIIGLIIAIGVNIERVTNNIHTTNKYLQDINSKLDEIVNYIRDKIKD